MSPEEQEAVWNAVGKVFGATEKDTYGPLQDAENYLKYIGGLYCAAALGAMIAGWSVGLDFLVAACMVGAAYQAEKGEVESYARDAARQWTYTLVILFAGMFLAFITITVGLVYIPSIMVVFQIIFLLIIFYGISAVLGVRKEVVDRVKADPNAYRTDAKWLHEMKV